MPYEKLITHINRKRWWHVPPRDPSALRSRGKFYASSLADAEFWGRPLNVPQKVLISNPLVGDERTIEATLFGKRLSTDDISMDDRWALDARMKQVALRKGFDSIVLMTPKAFSALQNSGTLPRSIELNVLRPDHITPPSPLKRGTTRKRKHHADHRLRRTNQPRDISLH